VTSEELVEEEEKELDEIRRQRMPIGGGAASMEASTEAEGDGKKEEGEEEEEEKEEAEEKKEDVEEREEGDKEEEKEKEEVRGKSETKKTSTLASLTSTWELSATASSDPEPTPMPKESDLPYRILIVDESYSLSAKKETYVHQTDEPLPFSLKDVHVCIEWICEEEKGSDLTPLTQDLVAEACEAPRQSRNKVDVKERDTSLAGCLRSWGVREQLGESDKWYCSKYGASYLCAISYRCCVNVCYSL
jgi:hypothetical protein